jgi:hypothetical protein
MAKSATGVTEVITGGETLLVGTGSDVGDVTLAVFVSDPEAGAVTMRVKFVVALATKEARLHDTTPAVSLPPPVALTNVTPAGKASVTVMVLADEGPKLVTEIV